MAIKQKEQPTNEQLRDNNLQTMLHTANTLVSGKSRDLSLRQLAVLLNCGLIDANQTVRGLAARMKVSKPAVTRAADRLQDEGLTARKADPSDRRSVFIVVTPKGRSFLRDISRIMSETPSAKSA